MRKRIIVLVCFIAGCAHHSTLQPEVSGNGAKAAKNGVVYLVPEKAPILKMKLVSLGPTSENMLHLRIYFLKKESSAEKAYLDPREQSIELPESKGPIQPTKVHASTKAKPLVQLLDTEKHSVELLFPLPTGGHDYPFIKFHWKLHYVEKGRDHIIDRVEKYSSVDSYSQHAADDYSADGDFPYEEPWLIPVGWIEPDYLWW